MKTRYTRSPADVRHYSTEQLKGRFLVEEVFIPSAVGLTYTHNDRVIFGDMTPTIEELEIILDKELGADYFSRRHELGVISIGGSGFVKIDGTKETIEKQDGYYTERETEHVCFSSESPDNSARFYISRMPTHHKYPNVKTSIDEITPMKTGDPLALNQRKIY